MLEAIEQLLILQDRDQKLLRIREELGHIPLEREQIQRKYDAALKALESSRLHVQKIESERKELELQVESLKQRIEKYSLQQFQTKKNEEYRALTKEINACQAEITRIEDAELELMEKGEAAEKKARSAKAAEAEAKRTTEGRLSDLAKRETALQTELEDLASNREELASVLEEEDLRNRYERLFNRKRNKVVVGIQHGVCGGCHMQLSRQIVVSCQADQEIMNCPNCGRILYYTHDMDLATAE